MRRLLLPLLAIAACGSEKEGGKRERPAAKSKDVSPLFTGTTVTLPPDVAKAAFGASEDQVKAATGATSTYLSSKALDSVSYNFDYSHAERKLDKIGVSTQTPLEPLATKQWGAPIKTAKGAAFWFDAKTGLRAWLPEYAKGTNVAFSRYDSLETLLGPTGFALAFAAGKPLLGATLDELKAAWGSKLCDFDEAAPKIKKSIDTYRTESFNLWHDLPHRVRLCLPLPRFVDESMQPYGDELDVGRMGKIERVSLAFQTGGSKELVDQATKFFDAKFGTPTVLTDSSGATERWYFDPSTHQRAMARFIQETITLDVSRYTPVAELLADGPSVMSVATKSMPGGAPAAIGKEDPEHFNPHGALPELVFPASDFGREELEVDLESWDKAPTTYGYKATLFHTNNEAAGDAVFAILEKRFGKAKKDDRTSGDDHYFTWAGKGGQKILGRRVSQQWMVEVTKE